jgi:pyridoxal phosphate enzyme (YggS family)
MDSSAGRIADNLQQVRDRIARAARAAGRRPEEIRLIGVTKYVDAGLTAELLAAGCCDLGESRPQQLWDKAAAPELAAARWHLIGHLQRNKIRRTLPLCACIHSLDSLRLLDAVQTEAEQLGLQVRGLLEVNCSGDASKHGFAPAELAGALARRSDWPRIELIGLMTMAAREGELAEAYRNFVSLRELRDEARTANPREADFLPELSMGMSGDFEEAIRAGATMVRVGSTLWEGVEGVD